MQLKEGMTVIAPKGCEELWLTRGNEYKVLNVEVFTDTTMFTIIDDNGVECHCSLKNCSQLNGGDWIIKPEADPRLQQQIQLAKSNIEICKLMKEYVIEAFAPKDRKERDFVAICDQQLANEKELLTLELMLGIKNINP